MWVDVRSCVLAMTLAGSSLAAFAAPVVWEFPRTVSCHEGLAFSDGVTGVLVWGGGDTVNLTVGRGDLWDHRGGYPWKKEQSYTNIVALVRAGRKDALLGLFKQESPPNWQGRYNPYLLPLGRVVVKLPGAELARGELDVTTGLGKLVLKDGREIGLAMSKKSRSLVLRLPEGLRPDVVARSCMELSDVGELLKARGFLPPVALKSRDGGGFVWRLPAGPSVTLAWSLKGRDLSLATCRGDTPVPAAPGYEAVRGESVRQWQSFWREGARVRLPDPVVQELFDYGMYRFGAMTDPDGVPAGLQGPWLEDDRLAPWCGDFHFNINVQECYSPAYRGGHFAHLLPLFRMVLSWRPLLKDNARKFADVDGYVLPHSVDDRGVCIGGFWSGTIDHASTAWVADMMMRYVRYSRDVKFLREGAYDFMKGAMNVYRAMMEEHGDRLSLPLGPSPEWGGADVRTSVGRDPSFQLAAAHRLARDLVDAARLLGEAPDPMWLDVERRLPSYTAGKGGIHLFVGQPFTESHRHHSHLAGFYPFDTIDLGEVRASGVLQDSYDTWVDRGTGAWTKLIGDTPSR